MTLESKYRRLMPFFPKAWRKHNEDEFIGTLLDTAPPNHQRLPLAETVDLLVAALRLRTRSIFTKGVCVEVQASVRLAAGLGLSLLTAAIIGLIIRKTVHGLGLGYQLQPLGNRLLLLVLFLPWPIALVMATTRRTTATVHLVQGALLLGASAYLYRAWYYGNLIDFGSLAMYLGVPLIVVILLRLALADGCPLDRRWVGAAVIGSVPASFLFFDLVAGSTVFTPVALAVGSFPALVVVGWFWPRVVLAAGLLSTPVALAGFGFVVEALTTFDQTGPGPAIIEVAPSALGAGLILSAPTILLLGVGLLFSRHRAKEFGVARSLGAG